MTQKDSWLRPMVLFFDESVRRDEGERIKPGKQIRITQGHPQTIPDISIHYYRY